MNKVQRGLAGLVAAGTTLVLGDRVMEYGVRARWATPRDLAHGPLAEAFQAIRHVGFPGSLFVVLLLTLVGSIGFLAAWLFTTPQDEEAERSEIGQAVLHDALRQADARVKLDPNHALSFSARFLARIKTLFR
jgi:hypothetical protein